MSVTEARSASKIVLLIQVEEPWFALPAPLPLHVVLALTGPAVRVAALDIVQRPLLRAAANLTASLAEVVVVDVASVALVTGDSRLALTFPFGVALQAPGPSRIAVAGHAVMVLSLVVVFATSFAVGAVSVSCAVQAVSTVAGAFVQILVEVAAVGETVTVAC